MKHILVLIGLALVASFSASARAADLGDCTPEKMALAAEGDLCHAAHARWRVEKPYYGYRVYRDLARRHLTVTDVLHGAWSWRQAKRYCSNRGFRMPSGYWSELRCKYGHPCRFSDFSLLQADGFIHVVPVAYPNLAAPNGTFYSLWTSYRDRDMATTYEPTDENQPDSSYGWGDTREYVGGPERERVVCVGR